MNLPNLLTFMRILAVPAIVALLYFPARGTCLAAALLFAAAAFTDFLDGHLARKWNQVTALGKLMDPLADKLLTSSTLIMLASLTADNNGGPWVPAWVVIVITAREFLITGIRSVAAERGLVMAADIFGKLKTVVQIAALIPLTLHYPWFGLDPGPLGEILLYIALLLTVFSGGNYLVQFLKFLRSGDAGQS